MANILVVDDEKSIRITLREFLKNEGHEVEIVGDADEALEILRERKFDVVVTDIVLPRISGVDLLRVIRQSDPFVQVVMMTGEPTVDTASESLRAGAYDYLFKPITKSAILKVVANAANVKLLSDQKRELERRNLEYQNELEKLVEQRTAELKKSEEQYRTLFETMSQGVIYVNQEGRISVVNPAAERILGITESKLHGHSFADDMWEYYDETGKKLRYDEFPIAITMRVKQPITGKIIGIHNPVRNEIRWLDTDVQLGMTHDGNYDGAYIIFEDITEQRYATDEITRQTKHAQALARSATVLSDILDIDSLLETVCQTVMTTLNVDSVCVNLLNEEGELYRNPVCSAKNDDIELRILEFCNDDSECKAVFDDDRDVILVSDISERKDRPGYDKLDSIGAKSMLSLRIRHKRMPVGMLTLVNFAENRGFRPDELSLISGLAAQAAQAILNARLYSEANRRLDFLQGLRSIERAISSTIDLDVVLEVFLNQAISQLRISACDILLFDHNTMTLDFASGQGFRTRALRHTRLRMGQGFAGQAAMGQKVMIIDDLPGRLDKLSSSPFFMSEGFNTYIAAPLIAKGQVVGVMELFNREPLEPDYEWREFLDTLAGQAAIAIDNAALFKARQQSSIELLVAYDLTLEGWSKALDLRDRETEGHSLRVTEGTERLARHLNYSPSEITHMRRGALLHDIGKLGIPDGILLKPGSLNDEEWSVMKLHPSYAYEWLSPIPFLKPALEIPYSHHERWDGSGYPRKLVGEEIPMAARIFAVIDVWDALTSDRPYRRAWSSEQTIEYLKENSGVLFDPKVVDAFITMHYELAPFENAGN